MTTFAQALTLAQRGDMAGAEKILEVIIKRERKNADAFHLLANIRHSKGDAAGALKLFETASRVSPNDSVIAFNHAAVLAGLGRHAEAEASFARAVALRPDDAEAMFARAASLAALKRYEEALACYDAARSAGMTSNPQLYANRGATLAALGRHEEAIASCDRALAANPNDVEAHFNRGAALLELGRSTEAAMALEEALEREPNHAMARAARSAAYANLGRTGQALADINFAISRQPDRVDHLKRRAYVLTCANRRADALAAYEEVLAQTPDDVEAQYGRADALLALGDFARGLDAYECRFRAGKASFAPPSTAPLWDGAAPLDDKTILVQGEQGFGDLFQFCRFVADLKTRGARVILQERPPTLALLQGLAGAPALVSTREPAPPADYHVPLAGLMRALGLRLDTIPAPIPYIAADAARAARWRERLGEPKRRRLGVAWSGVTKHPLQNARRLDAAALERIFSADADFVSLQLDAGEEASLLAKHGVANFGDDTRDFAELAALIETLDVVVSIDTGVAHLAAAMGKPVLIMLPFAADWRWLIDRADTPWYPQARLFRQKRWGDWSGVTDDVLAALK